MERVSQNPTLEARLNQDPLTPNARMTTIVSGGMDSVTLLYFALSKTTPDKVTAISFDYGQKHRKELLQAKGLCLDLGVNHSIVDLTSATGLLKSSLTDDKEVVPHGHYAEDNMKATVVPNRNAIMLSVAYGAAISNDSEYLLYGAHTGDHFIYPDCRPEFVKALDNAFKIGNEGFGNVEIKAPFSNISKSEILTLGLDLGVPYNKTWTCYEGQARPCLTCGTCVERTEAFLDNKVKDPLLTPVEWQEAVKVHKNAVDSFAQLKQ